MSYIDATEIDVQTSKPIQSVTLFLFSDKVMLVRRPASDVDGLDLCGLDQRMDSHGSDHRTEFFIPKDANTGKLKFIGWANLTDLDVFTGAGNLYIFFFFYYLFIFLFHIC